MKRLGFLVVWPSSLDGTKSRALGRKLPLGRAVRQPSLREIVQAAGALGLAHEPAERKALPFQHWEKAGYVAVKRNGPRIATLRSLAAEILRTRQREAQATEAKPGKR